MIDLGGHRAYLDDALAAAQAAPLSRRKALLAALLIDAHVDRLFAAGGRGDDILDYRDRLAREAPAVGLVLTLCSQQHTTQLIIEAVGVPLAEYGRLSTADFMVSLYNGQSVQRLLLVDPAGQRHDVHAALQAALAALDAIG